MKQVKIRIRNAIFNDWYGDSGPVICKGFVKDYFGGYPDGQEATLYIIPDKKGIFMIDRCNGQIFWDEYKKDSEPAYDVHTSLNEAIIKSLGLEEDDPIMRVSVYMET